jgi:hypothetical protein
MEYRLPGPLRQLVATETLTIGTDGVKVNVSVEVSEGVKVNCGVFVAIASWLAVAWLASSVWAACVAATICATCVLTGTDVAGVVPPGPPGRLHAEAIVSRIKPAIVKNLFLDINSPSYLNEFYSDNTYSSS